ncbi:MAG: thiamine pyrophosphate-dependent dehydrogenase E1 component subunit alpha [Candidatus Limnocylindrales bacterium]
METGVDLLRTMLRIRLFEEALYRLFMSGTMPGTMHQAIGQEAVAAGVGRALRPSDAMTSNHRGHGHAIAKGVPLRSLMAEMFGRSTGASGGYGGSLHIFDLGRGFLGTNGIVGAGVPIGVGAALALKLGQTDNVAVTFFGDGAANQGAVHEALNLAAIWKLPVVFICENNQYAVSLPFERAFAIPCVADRAVAYGMPGQTVDGNDALVVLDAARAAVARARAGEGPTLIECKTYRYKGHSRFEPAKYRPAGELEQWLERDPIRRLEDELLSESRSSKDELDTIRQDVEHEVAEAIEFARSSPPAGPAKAAAMAFVAG